MPYVEVCLIFHLALDGDTQILL